MLNKDINKKNNSNFGNFNTINRTAVVDKTT